MLRQFVLLINLIMNNAAAAAVTQHPSNAPAGQRAAAHTHIAECLTPGTAAATLATPADATLQAAAAAVGVTAPAPRPASNFDREQEAHTHATGAAACIPAMRAYGVHMACCLVCSLAALLNASLSVSYSLAISGCREWSAGQESSTGSIVQAEPGHLMQHPTRWL